MGSKHDRSALVITVALIIALGLVAMALIMTLSGDNSDDDSKESVESSEHIEGQTTTEPPRPEGFAQAEFSQFRFAAVADDAGICSSIGTDILARKRGSAVDAAIATVLCMGVVNAQSCGIGGGHFMTIYDT